MRQERSDRLPDIDGASAGKLAAEPSSDLSPDAYNSPKNEGPQLLDPAA
jgi:hypothetical protein